MVFGTTLEFYLAQWGVSCLFLVLEVAGSIPGEVTVRIKNPFRVDI